MKRVSKRRGKREIYKLATDSRVCALRTCSTFSPPVKNIQSALTQMCCGKLEVLEVYVLSMERVARTYLWMLEDEAR